MPSNINNMAVFTFDKGGKTWTKTAEATIVKNDDISGNYTVSKAAAPTSGYAGDVITYTITITMSGVGSGISNCKISDMLSPELAFVTGSVKINGTVATGVTPANITFNMTDSSTTRIEYRCRIV